jgi:hypothetical protein
MSNRRLYELSEGDTPLGIPLPSPKLLAFAEALAQAGRTPVRRTRLRKAGDFGRRGMGPSLSNRTAAKNGCYSQYEKAQGIDKVTGGD